MSKLYVFAIGGTGSRVLKALSMLLSAGVECPADTIIPVIIDPDKAAGDLTRTVKTMQRYNIIRDKLDFTNKTKNRFFKTHISEIIQEFRLPLKRTEDLKFQEYIEYNKMSDENKALISMLFSQKNLDSNMKVGFKGNPNIGSVVLDQFTSTNQFGELTNNFENGDKIFIISSIFGGTGASGFPLLLKILRSSINKVNKDSSNDNIANPALIENAPIGAITVLPYFKVKVKEESSIDSATFVSKTKSALSYYERNISDNNSLDVLYYIADNDNCNPYENNEGGDSQENSAHFIELASALAILDFMAFPVNGERGERITKHKEFGIETDTRQIVFKDLGRNTQKLIKKSLTQFLLFERYLTTECEKEYKLQPWARGRKLDNSFFKSEFIDNLKALQQDFMDWLKEMDQNDRRFSPFELRTKTEVFDMVKEEGVRSMKCLSSNYALIDNILNKQKINKSAGKEQQFIELFYNATSDLVDNKYNF